MVDRAKIKLFVLKTIMWPALTRAQRLRLYHRLKRSKSPPKWYPDKVNLTTELKESLEKNNLDEPLFVKVAQCMEDKKKDPLKKCGLRDVTSPRQKTTSSLSRFHTRASHNIDNSLVERILADLLHPFPRATKGEGQTACGNIYGFDKKQKRDRFKAYLQIATECTWLEDDGKIVAFCMYSNKVDREAKKIYLGDDMNNSVTYTVSASEFHALCEKALDVQCKEMYELIFICAQKGKGYGKNLFDLTLKQMRKNAPLILFASQARHQLRTKSGESTVDPRGTDAVTSNFYTPSWDKLLLKVDESKKLYHDSAGEPAYLAVGEEDVDELLWVRLVK